MQFRARPITVSQSERRAWRLSILIPPAMFLVIFAVDLRTPAELIVPMFYAVPVMYLAVSWSLTVGFFAGMAGIVLTFLVPLLLQGGFLSDEEFVNRIFVACLIMLSTFVGWMIRFGLHKTLPGS